MSKNNIPVVTLKDAKIVFRNFAGKPTRFNSEGGKRTFNIILPPDVAADMAADGWSINQLRPREEGEEGDFTIEVAISYKGFPPQITLIRGGRRINLGENEIEILDFGRVQKADLMLNPYYWEVNGKSGVRAYLRKLFITMEEDELDALYSDVPEAGGGNHYDDDTPFD